MADEKNLTEEQKKQAEIQKNEIDDKKLDKAAGGFVMEY